MTLDIAGALRAAWRLARRDAALLVPLAGLTIFLPQCAVLMLLPDIPAGDPADTSEAAMMALAQARAEWFVSSGWWVIAGYLAGLFGALAILTLYLDRRRPDVRAALGHALRVLPRYLLVMLLVALPIALAVTLGTAIGIFSLFLLLPAFYWIVRSMLAGAVLIAERPVSAVNAIKRSVALTRGNGLLLAALVAFLFFGGELVGQGLLALGRIMAGAGAVNPVAMAIVDVLATLVATLATLLLLLVQVVLYRRFSASSSGI